jgi:hypothetical protein
MFDEEFIRTHLSRIISLCAVPYVVNQPLIGSLIQCPQSSIESGPRMLINTEFYIDHTEPLEALSNLPVDIKWPLSTLLEGHEFIVLFLVGSNRKDSGHVSVS